MIALVDGEAEEDVPCIAMVMTFQASPSTSILYTSMIQIRTLNAFSHNF